MRVRGEMRGLEAAARDARYAALSSVTEDKGLMFLGQHSDDQLEKREDG